MERKEFLVLCQKVSACPVGVYGIKQQIPPDTIVLYSKISFYPVGCKITFRDGKPIYTAILHDLRANSVVECELEKVERKENNG